MVVTDLPRLLRINADLFIFFGYQFPLLAVLKGDNFTSRQWKISMLFVYVGLAYTLAIIGRGFVKERIAAYAASILAITTLHVLMHFIGISSSLPLPLLHYLFERPMTFEMLIPGIGFVTQIAVESCLYELRMRQMVMVAAVVRDDINHDREDDN